MNEIFTAIGLLLFIEGLLYTIFPGSMKKMLNSIKDLSEQKFHAKWERMWERPDNQEVGLEAATL